jgi:hypothetical protein
MGVKVLTIAIGLAIGETPETVTRRCLAGMSVRDTDHDAPCGRHAVDHSRITTRDFPSRRTDIIDSRRDPNLAREAPSATPGLQAGPPVGRRAIAGRRRCVSCD